MFADSFVCLLFGNTTSTARKFSSCAKFCGVDVVCLELCEGWPLYHVLCAAISTASKTRRLVSSHTVIGFFTPQLCETGDLRCLQICRKETLHYSSSVFGTKFQRKVPLFWRYLSFFLTQYRWSMEEAPWQKPARFFQSFVHNTGLWQTDMGP